MKTFLHRALKTLGVLAVLLLLFHLVENWRGKRAWEQWKQSREAQGDHFDFAAFIPPPVPDEQNFATHPLIAGPVSGKEWEGMPSPNLITNLDPSILGDWRTGTVIDLPAARAALKAQDLDAVLATYAAPLDQLAVAAKRPQSRMLNSYTNFEDIPALIGFRAVIRVLRFRALVRLQQGRTDAALEDTLTGLRVIQHLQKEPYLICQLLRAAMVNLMLQSVWEGVAAHRWNEAQLAELQRSLEPVDLLASFRLSFMAERSYTLQALQKLSKRSLWARIRNPYPTLIENPSWSQGLLSLLFIPKGWAYQNAVRREAFFLAEFGIPIDPVRHRIHVEEQKRVLAEIEGRSRSPYSFNEKQEAPLMVAQNIRFARSQSAIDQAIVACSLERFRLAKGDYPAALEALVPAYAKALPNDLVSGEGLHYERLDKDHFRLYSIGWNLQDDGGQAALDPKDQRKPDQEQGDWVWAAKRP